MYKKTKQIFIVVAIGCLFTGCASKQQVTKFADRKPKNVCVAEHKAVRTEVLTTIVEEFQAKGSSTQIVQAVYVQKHGLWEPTVNPELIRNCDAVVFYVANWNWDLATYMIFANIWVTDVELKGKLAQATYQAGTGPNKFINAKNKIRELVNSLFI